MLLVFYRWDLFPILEHFSMLLNFQCLKGNCQGRNHTVYSAFCCIVITWWADSSSHFNPLYLSMWHFTGWVMTYRRSNFALIALLWSEVEIAPAKLISILTSLWGHLIIFFLFSETQKNRKCWFISAIVIHVLPYVLWIRQSRLCCADTFAHTKLEATIQILSLVSF